jgi:hypothetical protein
MPYWMDVLAENPALINPTLNTTGPFRWFLLEALRDNKPMDRFVTELVMLRGSSGTGGSAGFGVAGENDAPFATKGQILASAFLGVELQCARCHDSPYHSSKQADLYGLAAMLERKSVTVPKTSMVPAAFFEKKARESLIKATLKPGEKYLIWQSQETIFLKKVQKPKGFAELWQRMDEIGDDPNPLSTEDICQLVKEVRQEQTQQNHETPS